MVEHYDSIGVSYGAYRRPDPRLCALILGHLGNARSVVNVGAGTGAYEPTDRRVVAVEPSRTMVGQRDTGSAPVVRASATHLPFRDSSFDAAMAILTIHHWPDRARGLRELLRVSRDRCVLVTWDPAAADFWLITDYFPEIGVIDRDMFPTMDELRSVLGTIEVHPFVIPADCTDGFLGSYWQRPSAYLDAGVRRAMSVFSRIEDVDRRLERLKSDLEDGRWEHRHGHLSGEPTCDVGYRVVVARPGVGT